MSPRLRGGPRSLQYLARPLIRPNVVWASVRECHQNAMQPVQQFSRAREIVTCPHGHESLRCPPRRWRPSCSPVAAATKRRWPPSPEPGRLTGAHSRSRGPVTARNGSPSASATSSSPCGFTFPSRGGRLTMRRRRRRFRPSPRGEERLHRGASAAARRRVPQDSAPRRRHHGNDSRELLRSRSRGLARRRLWRIGPRN
jgi:hypothetical protein